MKPRILAAPGRRDGVRGPSGTERVITRGHPDNGRDCPGFLREPVPAAARCSRSSDCRRRVEENPAKAPPPRVFLKSGRLPGQVFRAEHSTLNYAVTDGRRGRPEFPLNHKRANGVGTLSRLSRSIAFLLSRVRSRLGGFPAAMQDACRYSDRPLAFLARYVRRRPVAHAAILIAVVAAVACSVGAQYGVKVLVDTLAGGLLRGTHSRDTWLAFLLLATLIPPVTLPLRLSDA